MEIKIPQKIRDEILHLCRMSIYEVSGLGYAEITKAGFVVRDWSLFPQKVTGVTTDLREDAGACATIRWELWRPERILWWWHSHAQMGVFWSGTDNATIINLGGGNSDDIEGGQVCATVFNSKGEFRSAYYRNSSNNAPTIFLDNITTFIDSGIVIDIEALELAYLENVEIPAPKEKKVKKGRVDDEFDFNRRNNSMSIDDEPFWSRTDKETMEELEDDDDTPWWKRDYSKSSGVRGSAKKKSSGLSPVNRKRINSAMLTHGEI